MNNSQVVPLTNLASISKGAASYLPEPATKGVGMFNDVMDVVGGIGKAAFNTATGGVNSNVYGDFMELLNLQMKAHSEMQSMTMLSNIEKSKHDTKMASLRNIQA